MSTCRLSVRLTPRGGKDRLEGWMTGPRGEVWLKARVSAPPVDGQANDALIQLLSKSLGASKTAIRFLSGDTARTKTFEIQGMDVAELELILGPQPRSGT